MGVSPKFSGENTTRFGGCMSIVGVILVLAFAISILLQFFEFSKFATVETTSYVNFASMEFDCN